MSIRLNQDDCQNLLDVLIHIKNENKFIPESNFNNYLKEIGVKYYRYVVGVLRDERIVIRIDSEGRKAVFRYTSDVEPNIKMARAVLIKAQRIQSNYQKAYAEDNKVEEKVEIQIKSPAQITIEVLTSRMQDLRYEIVKREEELNHLEVALKSIQDTQKDVITL